jgi:hypothetical protein
MAAIYAVTYAHMRMSFIPDQDGPWGVNKTVGLHLLLRNDEYGIIRSMLHMIFNDDHILMRDCPIIIPPEAYFKAFADLNQDQKAQVLWRAWYAVNQYCRSNRVAKHAAIDFKICFFGQEGLSSAFGKSSSAPD